MTMTKFSNDLVVFRQERSKFKRLLLLRRLFRRVGFDQSKPHRNQLL